MLNNFFFILAKIEKDPSGPTAPIAWFLGEILNFMFNLASSVTEQHALGIGIILLTIVARTLMLPLGFKSQLSVAMMNRIQPQVEKIKTKYGNTKDPEIQKKMNIEIQNLYSKNFVNPFSGCLPLLVTFPIFIALSYVMRQSFLYVDKIEALYSDISVVIQSAYDYVRPLKPLIEGRYPLDADGMFNLDMIHNMNKVVNILTKDEWKQLLAAYPSDVVANLEPLLARKETIETFLGINLISKSGFSFPGILIPLFSGATTFLSSWVTNRQSSSTDANVKTQQRMMMFTMPFVMVIMTATISTGVGLYWTVSNIYQTAQQFLIGKYYKGERLEEIIKKKAEKKQNKLAKKGASK